MSNDVDLTELARLIDAALASDNPSVKKALRNFMLVASIAESESEAVSGPFQNIFKKIEILEDRIDMIERRALKDEWKYSDWSQYINDPQIRYGDVYASKSKSYTTTTDSTMTLLDAYLNGGTKKGK